MEDSPASEPILTCLADIKSRPVKWLWPNRIPSGKISLLVGHPGFGKSFASLSIAAYVTTGQKWPDGTTGIQGDVLIISAEDDPADMIRPRLDAMGADVSRIRILSAVRRFDKDGKPYEAGFSLCDIHSLESALRKMPNCKLVIIDPIGSYLGADTDMHRDNEIRAVLAPVANLAQRYDVAVLVVAHRRKAAGERADDGVLGSVGFVGIARATWHVTKDRNDPTRRLLLPGKNNLAPEGTGLAFSLIGSPPTIQWESESVTMTADDYFSQTETRGPVPAVRNEIEKWLAGILSDGQEHAVSDIKVAADSIGFNWKRVQRAADNLPLNRRQEGVGKPGYWQYPTASIPAGQPLAQNNLSYGKLVPRIFR